MGGDSVGSRLIDIIIRKHIIWLMLLLRDLPKYETLERFAERYPRMDIDSVTAFLTLLRVASDLIDGLDHYLACYDLLQGRWMVLVLLMREENFTAYPSVLAEKAGVTRATMTGLLENLERDGLINRSVDADDRRRAAVHLTSKGLDKMDSIMPDYYSRIAQLMSEFSESEKKEFIRFLNRLTQQVSILEEPSTLANKD